MAGMDVLRFEERDGVLMARVVAERLVDLPVLDEFRDQLFAQAGSRPKMKLVLDVSAVTYLSSSALGKLVAVYKKVKETGGAMVVAGLKPALLPVFKVTSLDKVFEFHADPTAAVLELQRKRF